MKRLTVAGNRTQDTSGLSHQCSATEPQQPDNHQQGSVLYVGLFLFPLFLPHNVYILLFPAGKFNGGIKLGSLVVGVETAKLKSTNSILYTMHNDVMHAVALLASLAPLYAAVHVCSSALTCCQFYFL